jgi:hypothetical protein
VRGEDRVGHTNTVVVIQLDTHTPSPVPETGCLGCSEEWAGAGSNRRPSAFPHAAQAITITRKNRPQRGGHWTTVTVYAITSLAAHQARPDEPAAWIRQHRRSRPCTTFVTPPSVRTPHKSVPAADPRSWQPSATSPSRS